MGEEVVKARIAGVLAALVGLLVLLSFSGSLLSVPSALLLLVAVPVVAITFAVYLIVAIAGYFGITFMAKRDEADESAGEFDPENQPDDIWLNK